jgi:hypothetical protein
MIFSENQFPLFRIMFQRPDYRLATADVAVHIDLDQCADNSFDSQINNQICGRWDPESGQSGP